MEFDTDVILLIIAGGLGGFVSGLLGVGGGIVFVPILDYFLHKNGVQGEDLVRYTLANSFFAIFISGLTGSLKAFRMGSIHLPTLFAVGISAIISILITSWFISLGNWYSPLVFKLVFSAMLIFTLIKTMMHIEVHGSEERMNTRMGVNIGLMTGLVSGLSGLGGGIIMIPLFMILGNMNIKKASSLSLAVIPLLSVPNVIYYSFAEPATSIAGSTGYLAWSLALPMVAGVMLTVRLGLITAHKLSAKSIKIIFAGFIIITIIKTLTSLL